MKKITLILTYILLSCDNLSLEQKKKRVDELKNSLVEIYTEIDNLEKEISEFDSTFNNKNYELVSTISPYSGTFSHEISLRGNIQSNMNILIVPEVMGQVDKIYVEEEETVKKGKILASINSDIIQSNIEEIESSLNLLKTIYDRQSNLWKEEIGSEIEYLRSKTNYESAKNRYNALKIQASKFSITAPFSGIIESVNTKVGEVSSPGMPAFRMFNDSDSYISVDVPENYLNSFITKNKITELHLIKIVDIELNKEIAKVADQLNIKIVWYENPLFILNSSEVRNEFSNKKRYLMGNFYKKQRKNLKCN